MRKMKRPWCNNTLILRGINFRLMTLNDSLRLLHHYLSSRDHSEVVSQFPHMKLFSWDPDKLLEQRFVVSSRSNINRACLVKIRTELICHGNLTPEIKTRVLSGIEPQHLWRLGDKLFKEINVNIWQNPCWFHTQRSCGLISSVHPKG